MVNIVAFPKSGFTQEEAETELDNQGVETYSLYTTGVTDTTRWYFDIDSTVFTELDDSEFIDKSIACLIFSE